MTPGWEEWLAFGPESLYYFHKEMAQQPIPLFSPSHPEPSQRRPHATGLPTIMTDIHYATTLAEADAPAGDDALFYVVSIRKFTILYLATLGMYGVYWFYQNWARYNRNSPYAARAGNKIWPLPRAIFSVFFIHDLFRKVKAHAGLDKKVNAWSQGSDATFLVVLILLSNMLDRASAKSLGSPVTDVLSLLILLPLVHYFIRAQEMINISCRDQQGRGNADLSKANYAWIAFGALLWCLIVVGLFLP